MSQNNVGATPSVLQVVLGAGLIAGGVVGLAQMSFAGTGATRGAENPAAVSKASQANPAAVVRIAQACKACNPCAAKKGCGACNPCAAKKGCGACNPCAAKKACSPCNPCAAKSACGACNPCNPCGGGGLATSARCDVPRLVQAALCNPCAAKKACGACNPCAAKKGCGACNPCAAKKACGACNPCAAKKGCGACNPCAAKKACSPCNPCAAKSACGACNPCGPCGAGEAVELTAAEAKSVYECLTQEMAGGYAKSGMAMAANYTGWQNYSTQPYVSDTHGARYVNNYANAQGADYKKYEDAGPMPVGAIMAKDSFMALPNGKVAAGPLFLMEKMPAGFYEASGNWRYTMIMPDGSLFGATKGKNSVQMQFCIECHAAVAEDQDHLFFLPEEYRVN